MDSYDSYGIAMDSYRFLGNFNGFLSISMYSWNWSEAVDREWAYVRPTMARLITGIHQNKQLKNTTKTWYKLKKQIAPSQVYKFTNSVCEV